MAWFEGVFLFFRGVMQRCGGFRGDFQRLLPKLYIFLLNMRACGGELLQLARVQVKASIYNFCCWNTVRGKRYK